MYQRYIASKLIKRLSEQRKFMQVITGPRQTGKTTAVKQAVKASGLPSHIATADSTKRLGEEWIQAEWLQARRLVVDGNPAVLVLDEIQKVDQWSEAVKALWDEDCWDETNLLVVLSGSSSLLIEDGLSESLAGRFEVIRSTHWTLSEMAKAFDYELEDYLKFGGYPACSTLNKDEKRWKRYMRESIIETTISRDVLQKEQVRKPALMRALFELGAQYSAQELSYRKILGQLDDKGNTDIIKHYLDLLEGAGMMSGLQKFDSKQLRSKSSSPRLMVHDPSLMTASWKGSDNILKNPSSRGHLVETAVGAYLIARGKIDDFDVYWWRDGNDEVDFVIQQNSDIIAIEVKSGRIKKSGMTAFLARQPKAQPIIVGSRNASVESFLAGEVPLF